MLFLRKALLVIVMAVAGLMISCAASETNDATPPEAEPEEAVETTLENDETQTPDSDPDSDPDPDLTPVPGPVPTPDPIPTPAPLPDSLLEPEWEREPMDDILIRIDGVFLETDVPPVIMDGRTMVPMRALLEALGAEVEWDSATQTVEATREELSVRLTIDSHEAFVGRQQVELATPPTLHQGRTLVPLRFVSEALGFQMSWDVRVIDITSTP